MYALHDGSTFAVVPTAYIPVAFSSTPSKNLLSGTPNGWKEEVALPLSGQPLGAFLLMAAFMPIVQRFMPHVANFAVEVIGPEGIGKSTLLQIVSTVFGGTGVGSPDRYWTSCAAGIDALPSLIGNHRDHPLILDDVNVLFAAADKKVAGKAYALLGYDLGRVETARGGLHAIAGAYRGLVMLTANTSLRAMSEKPVMASDQIITLIIPPDWPNGVFAKLPNRYANGSVFAEALSSACARNHGIAVRGFLRHLLAEMGTDQPALQQRLDLWQERFLKKARVDRNSGKHLRVARFFAAVYAAGRLAKRYKILPHRIMCMRAVITCYSMQCDASASDLPFRERLEALIASDRVVAVTGKEDAEQTARVHAAIGTLHVKGGYRELRVPMEHIGNAFPDWGVLKGSTAVIELLVGEKGKRGQHKSRAKLAPGFPKVRLYCFRLALAEPSMFGDPA